MKSNGKGLVSLEGFKQYVQKVLTEKYPNTKSTISRQRKTPGKDVFDAFEAILGFAFEMAVAWTKVGGEASGGGEDESGGGANVARLSQGQFRVLHAFLCVHAAMYDAFFAITQNPAASAKMSLDEWLAECRVLWNYGFFGFDELGGLKGNRSGLSNVFSQIDTAKDKAVDLNEWFSFIIKAEIAKGTTLGACLSEEPPMSQQNGAEKPKAKMPPPLVKTSFGLKLWKGVSKELVSFVKLFSPLAEHGEKADADRIEAFALADP